MLLREQLLNVYVLSNAKVLLIECRCLHRNAINNSAPQREAWIVERMGRFRKILKPVSFASQ